MSAREQEARLRAERARRVALFRYELIQEVINPVLSTRQRGVLVRELAAREHNGPFGEKIRVARNTIDRWVRWWRTGGFAALVPQPARVQPRTPAEVLDLAAAIKKENLARTATQVARILRAQSGWSPSERTLQRHFERLELAAPPPTPQVFGRFEASRPNEIWTGDALHGPLVAGRKTYLFAFLDDHSRAVMAARFGFAEDTVRLAAALRPALATRGVPEAIYVDNGSAFVDSWLLRGCATLGIKLIHSAPGRPEGRGKIERFFRTVREQFLVELSTPDTDGAVADLATLNRLFVAWVETVYHVRVHTSTGVAPLARWRDGLAHPLALPTPTRLREAFLWSAQRTVTKTATVSLHGNVYQVDPVLVGRAVDLVFDPFDLADVEIRYRERSYGTATVFRIGRHSHPKARPEQIDSAPPPTGIDYLRLIDTAHDAQLGERVNYSALAGAVPDTTGRGDEPVDSVGDEQSTQEPAP
jgi:putative transposase